MNLYERFYMYLFGFGSLVNIKSAQNSYKNRELKKEDLIPVKIRGYKRVWNSIESIYFEKEIVNGIFLNIQKDENSYIFGVMIKISEEEFEVLKLRGANIDRKIVEFEIKANQGIVVYPDKMLKGDYILT